MKKKLLYLLVIILLISSIGIYKIYINETNNISNTLVSSSNEISIMLENTAGEYVKSDMTTWPINYDFNEELSYCLNNSSLNWNDTNKKFLISSTGFDKCYIYFKIKKPQINSVDFINVGPDRFTIKINASKGTNEIQAYNYSIDNGETYQSSTSNEYTYTELTSETTYQVKVYVKDTSNIDSSIISQNIETQTPTLLNYILAYNGGVDTVESKPTPNFATIADTNEGMFVMDDDYGTSYYFRGAIDNNWVKFANIYWRIVRINGDGSVKLIYTGTTAPMESEKVVMIGTGTQVGTSAFNNNEASAEYSGYMYTLGEQRGLSTPSTMKTYLEDWYSNNLLSHDSKIADIIFCNDRSTVSATKYHGNLSGNGIGSVGTYFGAAGRLLADGEMYEALGTGPSLVCPHKDDSFTKSDNVKGNAKLTHKIGLLTADEATVGGIIIMPSLSDPNDKNYLYTNNTYWFGSPSYFDIDEVRVKLYRIYPNGALVNQPATAPTSVRPVISLESSIMSSGNGTWNNPYIIN